MDPIVLDKVEASSQKAPKMAALQELKEDTLRFLKLVCDPLVTFGVTVDEDYMVQGWENKPTRMRPEMFSDALYNLHQKLASREWTGNRAANEIRNLLIEAPTKAHLKWSIRFLNKNLRAGFSSSTLNKIWPDFIKEFEVSLAEPYQEHEIVGEYHYEPKLDGLRMVIVGGVAYTRNGRKIESVQHIIDELNAYIDLEDWVLDGEIMGAGDFDEASGTIRKKGEGPNQNLYYNLFDIVFASDWFKRAETEPFKERRKFLEQDIVESENVRLVPSKKIIFKTPATGIELNKIRDEFIAMGFEGAMLKKADAPYRWKRSDDILKLKKMETVDARITGTYEGKGRHKGRLGGIFVEVDGVETKVGSGFSDEQRDDFWRRRTEIVDEMSEIQFQNKTRDGRLRFPVFLKLRPDKS